MLPQEILEDAIKSGACESGMEWAQSEDATTDTVPDKFRRWWVLHLPQHLTPWWDGKCCTYTDGKREWYLHGQLHRPDGPAREWPDGRREWWRDGRRHRPDGPAVECADGAKHWWRNGMRHRPDGPAIKWADGSEEWYRDDILVAAPN